MNCTLTAPPLGARAFCEGLRKWDPDLFNDTDFKLTDGLKMTEKFKALTLKNTLELVAYGRGVFQSPHNRVLISTSSSRARSFSPVYTARDG